MEQPKGALSPSGAVAHRRFFFSFKTSDELKVVYDSMLVESSSQILADSLLQNAYDPIKLLSNQIVQWMWTRALFVWPFLGMI